MSMYIHVCRYVCAYVRRLLCMYVCMYVSLLDTVHSELGFRSEAPFLLFKRLAWDQLLGQKGVDSGGPVQSCCSMA